MPDTSKENSKPKYTEKEITDTLQKEAYNLPFSQRKHLDIKNLKAVISDKPLTGKEKKAGLVAEVDPDSRNTVVIRDPERFMQAPRQIVRHETMHLIQNGVSDDDYKKFPADATEDVYNYGGTQGLVQARSQGKRLQDFPPEQQAEIMQYDQSQNDGYATATPEQRAQWDKIKPIYDAYTNDLNDWKMTPEKEAPITSDNDPRLNNVQVPAPNTPTLPAQSSQPQVLETGVFHAVNTYGMGDPAPGDAIKPPPGFVLDNSSPTTTSLPTANAVTPPPGFVLDNAPTAASSSVTPPPGFVLDSAPSSSLVKPPPGFVLDSQPANQSPENGQPQAPLPYQGESGLKKVWDWANTPLTESLGGFADSRPGAGGVERAFEKIASGFTSPLSIALTLGTFGTAGFLESAGSAALREAGMSAAQIADVAKGSEAATEAMKTGQNIKNAVTAAGADYNSWKNGIDLLYGAGMKEADLTGGNAVERGASTLFRKFGLTPGKAQTAAKTMQAAVNAGFTYQQVQAATQMSPRALDALADGDYDHFAEYATEALASGAFGALGATHAFHTAGELVEPLTGTKLRPSDQTRAFSRLFDDRDGEHQQINQNARLLTENMRQELGYQDPKSPLTSQDTIDAQSSRLAQLYHGITLGFDKNLAAEHFNAIAEAAGRDERLPTNGDTILNRDEAVQARINTNSDNMLEIQHFTKEMPKGNYVRTRIPLSEIDSGGAQPWLAKQYAEQKGEFPPAYGTFNKGHIFLEDGNHRAVAAELRGDKALDVIVPQKDYNSFIAARPENGQPIRNQALPENLSELIANSTLKDKPSEYIDHVLDTYRGVYNGFSDVEMNVAKNLRDVLDKGLVEANANGLMGEGIENYMKRVWEKPSPTANQVIHEANTGRFLTNVSMARQRVFQTELEPLLKGYKFAIEDPISSTSDWMADVGKAIANRKLLGRIMDKGLKASDSRPAVVLLGRGSVLEGSDGENPATMINPNSVRDIRIGDQEVQNLKQSGDLDKFLADGNIVNYAQPIHLDNIDKAIDRLENRAIGSPAQYDEQGNNILRQNIQTLKDVRDGKLPESALNAINDQQKPIYVWRPQDFIQVDNPGMRKWNFVTHDPSGDPVYIKSDLAVHPEFADYLKTRLGLDDSLLRKWGPTRALLSGNRAAKNLLLAGSPFHQMQEWLRGVMMGVWSNPFGAVAPTIEDSPVLKQMVRHRLILEPDYKALQDSSEGVAENSKLLSKLPFNIGKSFDWYHDFLFKRYIPSLKARAAIRMFDAYKEAHPDWTDARVAEVASAHVNDTFGGQNWRAMGRSATTQDWAHLTTLAPDWLESELRSIARLFKPGEGGIARGQFGKLALGMWGVARVLNLMYSGKPHLEAPFGVATKNKDGREIVYSVRTLPTDLLHAATDPVGFLKGRLSPGVHTGVELLTGRDQFGRKLSPQDMVFDVARHNFAPIPVQSLGEAIDQSGPQVGNAGQVARAAGLTTTVYKTEAQKLAAELASNHSESGPIDPTMLHRHRVLMDFEDKLRSNQMTLPQVYQMVVQGDLSEADAKKISTNLKHTKGMDPETASLYTRASRLPAPELLQVWDKATSTEKSHLAPLLISARKKYLKKAMTDETPQERMRDPVLKRLMTIFPAASPF